MDSQHTKSLMMNSFSIITLFLLIFAGPSTSAQNTTKCPFHYLYHVGDGITDIGNSVKRLPYGPFLPPTRPPYGRTFPGRPDGRWCDGLIDIDFSAADFGLPNIVPYLSMNSSKSNDGVIFSVASSPVLNTEFFLLRDIIIPPYAAPLSLQLSWFQKYIRSICSNNGTACTRNRLANSLFLFGDIEANDIGYALTQGKSIQEVTTYVPFIIEAQINAAKEVIRMGATRIIFPYNAPLGCYPYILTALQSNDPTAYDDLGCLKSVNNLIVSKNNYLQQAVNNLSTNYPNVFISTGNYYDGAIMIINQTSNALGEGRNAALKACCGIGGKYNFDSRRFCGSRGVPVCPNPNNSIYWDGLHFTQETYRRIERILVLPAISALNCTSQ